MKAKTVITTFSVVGIVIGAALILMRDSGTVHTLMDAVAIVIVITILSLQTWLRDRLFRPEEHVARKPPRRYRPFQNRRLDRIRVGRTTQVVRGSFRNESTV